MLGHSAFQLYDSTPLRSLCASLGGFDFLIPGPEARPEAPPDSSASHVALALPIVYQTLSPPSRKPGGGESSNDAGPATFSEKSRVFFTALSSFCLRPTRSLLSSATCALVAGLLLAALRLATCSSRALAACSVPRVQSPWAAAYTSAALPSAPFLERRAIALAAHPTTFIGRAPRICESGALLSRPTSIPPPRAPRVHPARYRTRAAVAVLPLLLLQLPLDFELLCMSNLPPPHARIPRRTSACAPAFTGVRFLLRTSYASSTYICSNVGARGSGWRWRAATAGSVPRAGNMLSSPSIVFAEASKERASLSRRFVALHEIVRLEITVVTRAHRPSLGRRVRLRQVPLSRFLDPRRHARHPHRRSPPYPPSPLHLTTAGSMQDEDETVRYDDTLPAKAVGDAEESSAQRTSFPTVWRALPTPSARQIPHHVVFVPHRSLTKSPHFTLSALPVPSSSKARWRRQENVSLRGVTCSRALALPERLRARAVRHHVKQAVMEHNALAHKRQVNSRVLGGSWWVWE
ncbi:hypothetical protein DFH06DRAFT_1432546 [Mycena polygramma]|nr:hypothetical protein DFH06DRAFT_1432546 [Mycena polygramma]